MAKRKSTPATPPALEQPAGEYTVLARRYRPQQFADLVGQEAVAQALVNALESNRVAHAYLFTGLRGVGKTSAARILAKALNCVHGPTAKPCDQCEICQSIATGEDIDVIEIDAASNNGVEHIRDLRQNVRNRPARARYKIYIIDEVHMLSTPAFNALLKTLEEPPAHVKFIFATTDVHKIPVTILSRCQRFDFVGIGTPRIVHRLRKIVTDESAEADDEALTYIARRAGGSMRDAQSLLDQLLAFGSASDGKRLTIDAVHALLGTANDDRIVDLASAVLEPDAAKALELFAAPANEGLNLGELVDQLIAYWRDLMLLQCSGSKDIHLSVAERHRETLTRQATSRSLDTILAGLDILATVKARLRGSSHARTLVEMALVRLCRLDDLVSLSQLAQWLGNSATTVSGSKKVEGPNGGKAEGPALPGPTPSATRDPAPATRDRQTQPLTDANLRDIWREMLAQVGGILAGNLQAAGRVAISGPNTLVLYFPDGYNHQREYCQESSRLVRAEEALKKLTGQPWRLRVEPGNRDSTVAPTPVAETENSLTRYRRQRAEALQQPLVQWAVDKLGAQIVHVDDGFGAGAAGTGDRTDEDTEEA